MITCMGKATLQYLSSRAQHMLCKKKSQKEINEQFGYGLLQELGFIIPQKKLGTILKSESSPSSSYIIYSMKPLIISYIDVLPNQAQTCYMFYVCLTINFH